MTKRQRPHNTLSKSERRAISKRIKSMNAGCGFIDSRKHRSALRDILKAGDPKGLFLNHEKPGWWISQCRSSRRFRSAHIFARLKYEADLIEGWY